MLKQEKILGLESNERNSEKEEMDKKTYKNLDTGIRHYVYERQNFTETYMPFEDDFAHFNHKIRMIIINNPKIIKEDKLDEFQID